MSTGVFTAGEVIAELVVVKGPPEHGERVGDRDLGRGYGQGVAAVLPPDAGHETALAQDTQQFGNVVVGNALSLAYFGDREALPGCLSG